MQPLAADEPTAVGPYRLLGRIGSGGMGRVYLGRSTGGRTVAVKIVHPHYALDEEFRARFRREVDAARRVGGAWTAPVLDADPAAPVPWVATAYVAGPSLAAAVGSGGPLPEHTVRTLGAGLAEALTAVHDLGLVHRDVKPSNVLLTLDGPLLIDFGIARATDGTASLTSSGVSIGSPGYMAPEQILGKGVTGAADVFSLGAVLAYAATGESPFPGDSSAALLYKVVHEEPELGPLDGELREVAAACLVKDPGARPGPAEVGRRLAPQGAARLVGSGWLPGTLVEQVSRSAVQLLNLEASPDPAESGPVGFSSPSVGDNSRLVKGQFGPPPLMPGRTPDVGGASTAPSSPTAPPSPSVLPVPPSPSGPPASFASSAGPAVSGTAAFGPATGAPVDGPGAAGAPAGGFPAGGPEAGNASGGVPGPREGAGGDKRPGRLSVTVAGSSTPGEQGRGRRVSCTVALAVAGALAAVTVGGGMLLRPLLGGGDHDTADGGAQPPAATGAPQPTSSVTGSAQPTGSAPGSAGPTSSAPGDSGTATAVPARYVGTWEGQATALDGSLPIGSFRLTVQPVSVGAELGRLRQTDQLGGVCTDVLTLKQVKKDRLVATSVGAEGNHAGCDPAAHTIELAPVGDDLAYTSDSEPEGHPESRMSKVG